MPRQVFGFKAQHKIGNKGELLFLKYYGQEAKKADGKKYDLFYKNKKVELKTDTYSMSKTQNFFMEKFGSIESEKIGGPWRACEDSVHYFVYFFIKDRVFFWFNPCKLAEFLDNYTKNMKGKTIPNKGYSTLGFTIPRDDLKHLIIRKDEF